ncbi:MAG: shikimate dehydrogenase [Acidimicrobiales bacterium]
MNWRLAVVGSPIGHSLSPQLHEAGLKETGLMGTSIRLECGLDGLDDLADLARANFDALSVTSPLKARIVPMCDELSEVATRARCVNSLLVRRGKIYATNTDGDGFVGALQHQFGVALEDTHAVVVGSGGAASAIVEALVRHGASSVAIRARNERTANELAQRFARTTTRDLDDRRVGLVVNTVPSLNRGINEPLARGVDGDTVAIDVSYEPRVTPWLQQHIDAGCRTSNGLAMLAFQAALQMQWWWGVTLDGAQLLQELQ